ncbi:hypothetical protein DOY81_011404, partial [Sarcophaga bullata]
EKVAKADDKQPEPAKVNPVEETKSKTEKRDSSVQTSSFGINSNAEPFKPMLNPPIKYEVAASANQQVYYGNKNAVAAGNAKNGASSQPASGFRGQYSQVATQTQQQQQQQQQPLLNKNAGKNVGARQQQVQQQILYAVPQNPPNHYERVSQQTPLQQQPVPVQRKQTQYVIAIPLSYLRQLQQQLVQHPQQLQQQEQPSNLQIYKGLQQFQLQPQQQQQAIYSIAGPLARDHQGAYRPFHRFALTPVNDVSTAGIQHHQIGSPAPIPPPALAPAPAPPGYVTQYVQIPASVLMAALQSAQLQPQQRPVHLAQPVYQQQHPHQQQFQQQALQQPPQQQLQPQVQYQQTIPQQQQQQHIQAPASQIFYLQPNPQQQLQPSQALTAPPVYAIYCTRSYSTASTVSSDCAGPTITIPRHLRASCSPSPPLQSSTACGTTTTTAAIATILCNTSNIDFKYNRQHRHHSYNRHHTTSATATSPSSPSPQQHQQQQPQAQHSTPFVEHLNNFQLSQGIHGPTPLPYLDLHPPSAVAPYYNFNVLPPTVPQPFGTSALQSPFTPLGIPNKVASFTNVVFQPFGGHAAPYHVQEINSAVAGSPDTVPYFHQAGGVRYGTHVLHPPTSAATYLAGGKPTAAVVTHPSPR